ncbi:hypothetical protein [Acetobacter malorum]|uniref:helix-turn-helix transcriptional regulator n=1 Tax=Acetobacter malorum TaxID=178901 RepID=UPI0012E89131|nr:hypothetical protein [Acetobacter malorum]
MDNIKGIIDDIHKTIDNKNHWKNVVKEISKYCNGNNGGGASLIPLEGNMIEWRYGSNDDKKADLLYYSHWREKSPMLDYVNRNINKDLFCLDDSFLSDDDINHHPFYQEFLKEFGVKRVHQILFKIEQGDRFILSVQSPWDDLDVNPKQINKKLREITPYIKNYLSIAFKFNSMNNTKKIFESLLEDMVCGIVFLNESNKIVHANKKMIDMQKYGLFIKNDVIVMPDNQSHYKFKLFLKQVEENPGKNFFKFYGKDGNLLSVRIIYFPEISQSIKNSDSTINKVVIFSPEFVSDNTENILKEFFLSPSQAKISCMLANGISIKEAAVKMNISEGTARQMVKEVFVRLGINSQNKLISFVKNISFMS